MNSNYTFRDVSEALPYLLRVMLEEGDEVPSRAGLTKELAHVGITLAEPRRRELFVPHRNPNIAAQVAETAWVLAGRNDVDWLKNYLPRAGDFSDDGLTWRAAYGPRLREQLDYVVDLLKVDPMSRQAVIVLWYPNVDTVPGKDIACNNWLHFLYRDGQLHLHVGIRSNDIIWGWSGINTFEWSVVLEIVSYLTGLEMGRIHYSVSSEHVYEQHWNRAELIVGAAPVRVDGAEGPAFEKCADLEDLDYLLGMWFNLEDKLRHGLPAPEIASFPEPMLRSWLYILEWWWTGDRSVLQPLEGFRLEEAVAYSIQPPQGSPFIRSVIALHNEKAAAYGDSWCRRGETLGILANIARKVDRLDNGGETSDETTVDTAIDLLVYLAKYRAWLIGDPSTEAGNRVLLSLLHPTSVAGTMTEWFAELEKLVKWERGKNQKIVLVDQMLKDAYATAYNLWT